jgi:hypothetical protein
MFGLFRKKITSPAREGVFDDFRKAVEELNSAEPLTRIKVGMSINTASTVFANTFKGAGGFQSIPREEQLNYMAKLKTAQELARTKQDSAAALGFGLFNIWLCALTTKDNELMALIQPELTNLSKEANAIQSAL